METLADRQKSYENDYDYKIIKRIPVIIRCDGKNFTRVCKNLPKPFCQNTLNLMANTMLHSAMEIEGAIFAYQQSDEITFVLRNDQTYETEPWFNNRIQKICSTVASIVTMSFMKNLLVIDDPPDLEGDAIFDCRVFAVPSLSEAANNILFRQKNCISNSINAATQSELSRIFNKAKVLKMMHGKKSDDKIKLLYSECDIDYYSYYPSCYRLGTAAYKIPKIHSTIDGDIVRNKWHLDMDIPSFNDDRNFLLNILHSGHDVIRANRDMA